jgi:hypothetical protein
MTTAADIFTEQNVDQAYQWVIKQRAHFPPNADIWHLRFQWHTERVVLLQRLWAGTYQLSPQSAVIKANGTTIHLPISRGMVD